jgi:hypothetical protein
MIQAKSYLIQNVPKAIKIRSLINLAGCVNTIQTGMIALI